MDKEELRKLRFQRLDEKKIKEVIPDQPISKQPPPPQVSKTESAIRGGAQGVSFGFADEATAKLESMMNKDVEYEQALQESRAAYKRAQEANPITYTGSEIAGGVLPALIPTGATQATGAASLGRLALLGTGTGALSGLGMSEGKTTGEVAKDVVKGGLLGGGLPVLGRGIAIGAQKAKVLADEAIKTGLTGLTGKTRAFLDQLDKNPEQVKRIEEKFAGDIEKEIIPEIQQKINTFAQNNPFGNRAQLNSRKSIELIPENTLVSKNPAINVLDKKIAKLKKDEVTETSIDAIKKLEGYKERLINNIGKDEKKIIKESVQTNMIDPNGRPIMKEVEKEITTKSDSIPGRDLKTFLQNIQGDVERYGGFGNPTKNDLVGDTLINVRKSLDRKLKEEVPEYKNIMKDVQRDTIKSKRLVKQLMDKEGINDQKINTFIKSARKEQSSKFDKIKQTLDIIEEGGQPQGLQTLRQDLADINLKQAIEARGNQGSNVMLTPAIGGGFAGSALGNAIAGTPGGFAGGTLGTFLGGIAGRQLEQKGGKISESAMRFSKGIRTPTAIPESTQRGFALQQGIQKPLIDQFLADNAPEVRRKQEMKSKSKFNEMHPTRVKPK
jgi:hypothetical protein